METCLSNLYLKFKSSFYKEAVLVVAFSVFIKHFQRPLTCLDPGHPVHDTHLQPADRQPGRPGRYDGRVLHLPGVGVLHLPGVEPRVLHLPGVRILHLPRVGRVLHLPGVSLVS